jgi:hypothetical protein
VWAVFQARELAVRLLLVLTLLLRAVLKMAVRQVQVLAGILIIPAEWDKVLQRVGAGLHQYLVMGMDQ